MPVYLLHGFRWPRELIRIHIILENLDDAAAEWLVAPGTTKTLLENLTELHPSVMAALPKLRFIEQYDPFDLTTKSQPYAYVADSCHEIRLGLDIDEVRGKGVPALQWSAITELRDKLAAKVPLAWYVVVCGDEERAFDDEVPEAPPARLAVRPNGDASPKRGNRKKETTKGSRDWSARTIDGCRPQSSQGATSLEAASEESFGARRERSNSITRGLRRLFGRKEDPKLQTSRSLKDLRTSDASKSSYSTISPIPPVPATPTHLMSPTTTTSGTAR